jgi:hypothetical protein
MSEEPLNRDSASLEEELRRLAPRPSRIDRERLMFLAGQASPARGEFSQTFSQASRRAWPWPLAMAAMTTVAGFLGVLLVQRPAQVMVERVVYVEVEKPSAETPATAAPAVLELRRPHRGSSELASAGPARVRAAAADPFALPADLGSSNYLAWRNHALRYGVESWSHLTSSGSGGRAATPQTSRELLESLLDEAPSAKPSGELFPFKSPFNHGEKS